MHDQATRMREIAKEYQEREARRRPHILAVTSGKGGVGKSTIALNLSLKLNDAGQRVLLVDGDTNLGSLDVMLGFAPRYRMGDVLRGNMDVEDVLVTAQPGLKILPASAGDVEYPLGGISLQDRLFEEILGIEEQFDCIVIDTGAGLNDEVIGYLDHADDILLVTTPEPTAIMDAYAMMKVVWSVNGAARIQGVLNAVRSPREGDEVGRKLRMAVNHFLKRDLDIVGMIPADTQAPKAIVLQVPLVKSFPHSAAALSIQSLANHVLLQLVHRSERKAI
ncbi:MAG: MinD/ParA family protein [Bacteroidota bacterium]